jgi:two-component system chemotaxis sensor kinase CheA
MDPFEEIKGTFFQECDEQLADLEAGLLALQRGTSDSDTVNAVFRAVHSMKGGAGAFGMDALVRFAHVFETLMDELRSGRRACDENIVKTLLRAADVLADHVTAEREGGTVDADRSSSMIWELEACIGADAAETMSGDELDEIDFQPVKFELDSGAAPTETPSGNATEAELEAAFLAADGPEEAPPARKSWRVVLKPRPGLYAKANDPALLLRELERLGQLTVDRNDSDVPLLDTLVCEQAYMSWSARLLTESGEAAIREVFDFVEADCDLEISEDGVAAADESFDLDALLAKVGAVQAALETRFEPSAPGFAAPSILAAEPESAVGSGSERTGWTDVPIPDDDPRWAVKPTPAPAPKAPSASVAEPRAAVAAAVPPAAAPAQAAAAQAPAAPAAPAQTTIRVDLDRVDRLIDLVGELVIQQAMLSQRVIEHGLTRATSVAVGLDDLEQLTREIQDSVMAIRAQPVKSVFQRMPRLVREVSELVNKRVRLVTEGEGTEVDKTVIERLSEPITHMIRNSVDHGIEKAEDRAAAGKPAEGTVRLAALHRSGRIIIEVEDDGAGINRKRVLDIAVNKKLVEPDAILSDDEIDNLIFLPGFSTADTVSDISGRGVGMDVVKRSILALGGRISISSVPGKGSKFTLSLPLTLAVLDGMVVTVADQTLVAPLTTIVESLQPRAEDVSLVGGRDPVIKVRDIFIPLIDVGLALGLRSHSLKPTDGVAVLVESEGGGRAALLVEAIQGQRQVVIKSLEANYQHVPGIAAATILGDGRVALILDVDAIVSSSRRAGLRPEKQAAVG